MQLRYINRIYVLSKALRKASLTRQELYVLYSVHSINGATRFTDVHRSLFKNRITQSQTFTIKYLKQLVAKEFLRRDGNNFSITPEGIAVLQDVEHGLRTIN